MTTSLNVEDKPSTRKRATSATSSIFNYNKKDDNSSTNSPDGSPPNRPRSRFASFSKWIPNNPIQRQNQQNQQQQQESLHLNDSIAPPDHRENTAMHALRDTLPSYDNMVNVLPSLSTIQHAPAYLLSFLPPFGHQNKPDSPNSSTFDIAPSNNANCNINNNNYCTNTNNTKSISNTNVSCTSNTHTNSTTMNINNNSNIDSGFKKLQGNVVMMGGYRGSVLKDSRTNKRIWVPLKVPMGIMKPDISLGLSDEAEYNTHVYATKMLTTVAGFLDLGKSLKTKLRKLDKAGQINFINYGYDWRKNLDIASKDLIQNLQELKKKTGEGATVIAHSMGGLVVLHAIITAPDPSIFKAVILAGSPLNGCANVLGPLRAGGALLLNRETCNPVSTFSMRSSFYMLPQDGKCFETPQGKPIPMDFFSLSSWNRYAFSPVTINFLPPSAMQKLEQARQSFSLHPGQQQKQEESKQEKEEREEQEQEQEEGNENEDAATTESDSERETDNNVNKNNGNNVKDDASSIRSQLGIVGLAPELNEAAPLPSQLPRMPSMESTVGGAEATPQQIKDYLERCFTRVRQFHNAIIEGPQNSASMRAFKRQEQESEQEQEQEQQTKGTPPKFPKLALLVSDATPTVRGAIVNNEDEIVTTDYSRQLFGKGDGIVTYQSATSLPSSWKNHENVFQGIVHSQYGHVSLLGDLKSVDKALNLVL